VNDKIIEWAREANLSPAPWDTQKPVLVVDENDLERFAALVAAHAAKKEREACAMVCEAISDDRWAAYKNRPPYEGNETTRYSQHTEGESDGADLCADKIRARGEKPDPPQPDGQQSATQSTWPM
jgi:hypothetical protein